MNISQPVASYIGSVDFGFLTSAEIEAISVKKIQNPTTFDDLLNPVPGGLYDAALGAWADNACSTCHLLNYACPGHVGHIELPVPVYHVTFMDQLLRLLRARCVYCSCLKMRRDEVHLYTCKLRLIQHGLLHEAKGLENIKFRNKVDAMLVNGAGSESDVQSDEEVDEHDDLRQRRDDFVKLAIKNAGGTSHKTKVTAEKIEALSDERRAVVKEFLKTAPIVRACGSCNGLSHSYRKDRHSMIFRKPLGLRNKAKMVLGGFKEVNPLIKVHSERKAMQNQRREDRDVDEGIVADLEDTTSDESGEDIEMLEIETDVTFSNAMDSQKKTKKSVKEEENREIYMNAQEVHAAISNLFEKDGELLSLIYDSRGARNKSKPVVTADMFFIKNLLVPPSKFRPETKTGAGEITEALENSVYKQILMQCIKMNQIRAELGGFVLEPTAQRRDFRDLQIAWVQLQEAVNTLIDSNKKGVHGAAFKRFEDGIKQKLEKKEGLFRKNMMGKRVNFAARSVISPDPNIETNEIGVPPVFAKKLTYPEPVTNHNFYELKEAVLNGVEKWPGAAAIESENGQVINLRTKNFEERQALANQLLAPSNTNVNGARSKKVHRHLNNGDIVLMNRQPTLHKPSIMAHRARVLPGEKTIRMHYANCNTYNADFDGDEMNMHFPQNEIARAEALQIADTDHQYLVATSGKPLRGLIQDHISMGVWLTNRDTLFDREDYYQLLYSCLRPENNHTVSERIQTVTPAILKPSFMWTGKQVVTTVLKNITPETHPGLSLIGKSQTSGDNWGNNYGEDVVIFHNGELLCGILDKAHLGPSGGGFVHSIYEAYGHTIAGRLLGILGRLLTKLLHMRAFSCGMEDLLLIETGESNRKKKLQEAKKIGLEVAAKYVTLELNPLAPATELLRTRLQDVLLDDEKQAGLDIVFNSRTSELSSEVTKVCLPTGLWKPFPRNQMQAMTISGAKGTAVNANFISCNLGQQVLEGRRVPVMVSGKTLPSFRPFDTNVRAGGYITDRFLTGVKPQEYFFHAMAGREGLIDTAVKTSRSGYLQRCLIKGMEGLRVEYDCSVRDSDGTMVQFLYGEDALDVTKQMHLKDFKFLAENYMSLAAQLEIRDNFSKIPDTGARAHQKAAMKKVKKSGRADAMDPTLAIFTPGSNMGSTSERFAEALTAYCRSNPDGLIKDKEKAPNAHVSKKTFSALLEMKYMRSVVDPGEAVGIVAGQSIGEPSTQMTLNTFHLAGHSTKNVTLGIPRLREIVMTASKTLSTPSMTLHLIPELSKEAGEKFAKGITKVTLAEVMDKLSIAERIGKGIGSERAKIYDIRLDFFPPKEYQETYGVGVADILNTIEFKFIPQLIRAITKDLRQKGNASLEASAAQPDVGQSSGTIQDVSSRTEANGEGGHDEDNDGDDDATDSKQKRNRDEEISYEAPDEEEVRIAEHDRRQSSLDADVDDEGFSGSPRRNQHEDETDEDGGDLENGSVTLTKERGDRIKEKNEQVYRFSFDGEGGSWCEIGLEYDVFTSKLLILNLAESACHTSVIQSIPNLGACTYAREKSRDPGTGDETTLPIVVTSGVNLRAMHAYQSILNPHKIFTNDIHAMLTFYGVEACRATIIREMDAVFKGHSISVDNRHLNLIADFMTKGGAFTPFNRAGLKGAASPFMKMSFETTVAFLCDAVLDGDWDDLRGPSSRIVVGRVGRVGTGAFEVLMPVN